MTLRFSKNFPKQYRKLSLPIQKKADRQFEILQTDFRHPSLRSRKKSGSDIYEARVDYHYRFTYTIKGDIAEILTIGPHDEGLGKK